MLQIPSIVYRSKPPGSGIYTYKVDELPIEDKNDFVVVGGKKLGLGKSTPTSALSEQDLTNGSLGVPNDPNTAGIYVNKSSYVISKAAGTVSHSFNGVTTATITTDFFYNKQAKKKQ